MMVFRFVFKCFFVCGILFAVASYAAYLNTGKFWIPSIPSFTSNNTLELPSLSKEPVLQSVQPPSEPTYKWFQNGRWHYGDNVPEGFEAIKISKEVSK